MNITAVDFLNIYIDKLIKNKIIIFSKNELIKQYNFFIQEYPDLFTENTNKTSIENSIRNFIQCGLLFNIHDSLYIIKSNETITKLEPIDELLDYYFDTKKLLKEYQNLNIFITKSDSRYTCLKGIKEEKNIEWKLFTDGEIIKHNLKLVKGTKHSFKNFYNNSITCLNKSEFEYIDIINSSFVLQQEYINDELNVSALFTETKNITKARNAVKKYCKKSR